MLKGKESFVYTLAGVVIVVAYALTEVYERTVSFAFPVFNVSLVVLSVSLTALSVTWIRSKNIRK